MDPETGVYEPLWLDEVCNESTNACPLEEYMLQLIVFTCNFFEFVVFLQKHTFPFNKVNNGLVPVMST